MTGRSQRGLRMLRDAAAEVFAMPRAMAAVSILFRGMVCSLLRLSPYADLHARAVGATELA